MWNSWRFTAAVVMTIAIASWTCVPALAEEAGSAPMGPDSPAAAARLDDWKVIGPGGGGGQFYPTVSPLDTNLACVRCDMTGSYITHDGGESWRMFNLRSTSRFFVFDPVDIDVIYAKSTGLYRSADRGRTWELVHPDPDVVERISISGDHGEEYMVPKSGVSDPGNVSALAVDPEDSKTLYAAITDSRSAGLYLSTDWGKTWERLGVLPNGGHLVYVDPKSPRDKRAIYVVGAGSVSIYSDGRWIHNDAPEGVSRFSDASGGFSKETGKFVVYGLAGGRRGGSGGIYVSTNGGASWQQANAGIASKLADGAPLPRMTAIATCLGDSGVAYVSYRDLQTKSGESVLGVAKTTDYGKTWQLVWKDTGETPGQGMHDAWMNERFGPDWGENPISLGVAPTNPDICYGTDYGRTMRTTDGGKTWYGVYSKKAGGGWTTAGLDVTTCYGVHFDPFDEDRLFISYTDIGLFASSDYGSTWQSATTDGVPRGWVNTTYWMEFDPEVKGRVWAVMAGAHDLPRPKMWRRGGVPGQRGGICVSEDGGRTWQATMEGMMEPAATHVLMDPASPADARVLYVSGFGTGVWKSTDSGKTWTLKNNGIPGANPFAWWMAIDKNGVLYLVVARKSEEGEYGNEEDGALYRSTDGAESWQRMNLPEGLNGPNGISIDPDDPNRLYLAAWGRWVPGGVVTGGIWLSTDAGKTWKNVLDRDQYVYDVTIDPKDSDKLYACGFSSSAWRSTDRGETWTRIKGFNFKWATG